MKIAMVRIDATVEPNGEPEIGVNDSSQVAHEASIGGVMQRPPCFCFVLTRQCHRTATTARPSEHRKLDEASSGWRRNILLA